MKDNHQSNNAPPGEGAGRLQPAEGGRQDASRRDISDIDCQEGTMDHGRLGGNFDKEGSNYQTINNHMDRNKNELQEQEAPLKNTDRAYVQVREDGSPAMPDEKKTEEQEKAPRETSKENR